MLKESTIAELSKALAEGRTSSRALTEEALARIEDPEGEGARAFVGCNRERALAEADASDRLRATGVVASPLAGVPISVKDLFDVAGEVTRAGSVVLDGAAPAEADAPVVARLRAAGAVIVGRTNMTEFAYSGVGLNPHYGTPGNPDDRARVPGGSSSGAAVSVVDGMAAGAIGSDTGGSVRIPAALCGLVGFKPTQKRVPLDGTLPLSQSLDSIGPLARSVACCALLDAVISGGRPAAVQARSVAGLRLGVPRHFVLDGMDEIVSAAFERGLSRLSGAGVRVETFDFLELEELPAINAKGGFAAAEAYHWHRDLLAEAAPRYDPRVRARIERGAQMTAADYLELLAARRRLIGQAAGRCRAFDAVAMPATPVVAPRIAEFEKADDYMRLNLLLLRNPSVGNFLDLCAVTLPCQRAGELPVGLMLMGRHGHDRSLLALAAAIEPLLRNGDA